VATDTGPSEPPHAFWTLANQLFVCILEFGHADSSADIYGSPLDGKSG